ncbi:MAG: vitamin K epoxide reductase family protein, partial [Chitinophagaceae bacterium]
LQLESLPLPLIAHFKNDRLVLVTGATGKSITYFNSQNKKETIPGEDFAKQWDGVALLAETNSLSGETDFSKKQRKEWLQQLRIPFILLVAVLFIILNGTGNHSLLSALFSMVMLAGIFVSALLLWYEIDKGNPLLHKICTAGKQTNCSAILQSGAAKLWGIISWSEIGFAYFTGGFLSLLLSGFNPAIVEIVAWLNLAAVPYIFFSVYYQWRVARQWCVLCLTVQSLLLAGFIICLTGKYYTVLPPAISVSDITLLIVSYLLPLLLWKQVKPLWLKAREGKQYKLQLLRLKHDPRIFEALLPRQKSISSESLESLGITLGNPEAKYILVKVCNPYCGPCARAHPEIEKLLEANPDIQARIIFTATEDEKDIRSKPVKHLMAIHEKGNTSLTRQALDDWYLAPKKDYEVFANKYPLNGELLEQGDKLKAMSKWCEKTEISFTPTFFVSSPSLNREEREVRQLPDIYGIDDLKYLLR